MRTKLKCWVHTVLLYAMSHWLWQLAGSGSGHLPCRPSPALRDVVLQAAVLGSLGTELGSWKWKPSDWRAETCLLRLLCHGVGHPVPLNEGGGGIAISWGVAAAIATGLWAHGGGEGGGFPCSSLGSPAPPGFPQHSSHFYNTRKEHDLNIALHSVLEWQGGKGNRGSKQHWEGWMCSRVTCSQSGLGAAQLCIQIGWLVSCRHSR